MNQRLGDLKKFIITTSLEFNQENVELNPNIEIHFSPELNKTILNAIANIRKIGLDNNQNINMENYGWDKSWCIRPGPKGIVYPGFGINACKACTDFPWLQKLHIIKLDSELMCNEEDPNPIAYNRFNECNGSYYGGCDWSWTRYTTIMPLLSEVYINNDESLVQLHLKELLEPNTRYAILLQNFGGTNGINQADYLIPFKTKNKNKNDIPNELKDKYCCICMENNIEMICVPCGHLCICERDSLKITECPICKKNVEQFIKVYIP
jgi:hypothetical protein